MSDRTSYTMSLDTRDLPQETIEAAFACLDEDAEDEPNDRNDSIVIRSVDELPVRAAVKIAHGVHEVLEEAGTLRWFSVREDPAYGWVGTLVRYQPDRGFHTTACDVHGDAMVPRDTALAAIAKTDSRAGLSDELCQLVGTNWESPTHPPTGGTQIA